MAQHTTAKLTNKEASLIVSQHETGAPIIPMAQIERLHEILPDKIDWVFEQTKAEGDFRRSETILVNTFVFVQRMASMFPACLSAWSRCLALYTYPYRTMRPSRVLSEVLP